MQLSFLSHFQHTLTHTLSLFLSLVCLTRLFRFCLLYLSHMIVVLVIFLKMLFPEVEMRKIPRGKTNKKNKTKLAALGFSKFQMAVEVSTSSFKELVTHLRVTSFGCECIPLTRLCRQDTL